MEALNDEVESLEAILMEDVKIIRNKQTDVPEIIETTVLPIVDDDSAAQQYVCVTLQVLPPPGYPDVRPAFKLLRPRGLDDACLNAIVAACNAKLDDAVGFPVVFDLIDVVREHLTVSNLPSGQCVVCLYGFSDGDEFTRTECFHYLHSYCLARHLNASRRNHQEEYDKLPAWQQKTADAFRPTCPVCREPIADDAETLKCAMPPAELQNAPDFQLTKELRELQRRMSQLFRQQKERGAIIDVEADSGPVISIETEEEIRRRVQRKQQQQQQLQQQQEEERQLTFTGATLFEKSTSGNEAAKTGSCAAATNEGAKNSLASALATPSTSNHQGPRCEPTNNNYQHNHHYNRRHQRGGRRHHHRDRDRDHERNHQHNGDSPTATAGASTSASAAAADTAASATAPATTQTAASTTAGTTNNHHHHHNHNHNHNHHHGKQSKAHSHGSAHTR